MISLQTAGFCSSIPLLGVILSNIRRWISDLSSSRDEETNEDAIARAENVAAQKHFRQLQHIKGF